MNSSPTVTSLLPAAACLLMVMLTSCTVVTSCPLQCQCKSQFYVYCRNVGLVDAHLIDVIARVPTTAILLDLSSNQITRLAGRLFSRLPKLKYLNIADNQLQELGDHVFSNLTALRELDLRSNQLRSLSVNAFVTLTLLEDLHLEANSLTSLPAGVFNRQERLKKLRLFGNSIAHLKAHTFTGLSSLELLNLSNNRMKSVIGLTFSGLSSLKKLNLNRNELSMFQGHAFSGLTSLEELDLSHNDISDVQFLYGNDFFLTLCLLYLSHNSIQNIPPDALSCNQNLKVLDLASNRIFKIESSSFKGLRLDYLKLDKNRLPTISRDMFKGASRISHLNLSSNTITDIKTGAFDSFRETALVLDLRFNGMSYIHPGMFRRMLNLRSLYLGHNHVSKIDQGSFADLALLLDLDLSRNKLTSLSQSTIAGPDHLRNLNLANTPLRELTGFALDDLDSRMLIQMNSTVRHVTSSRAVIEWPFARGSQLYWKVSVKCVSPPRCPDPSHPSNLKPYVESLTLPGLTSGYEYFVCINPRFLSPEVAVSQCVHVLTELTQSDSSPPAPTEGRQLENNSGGERFQPLLSPFSHKNSCLVMALLISVFLLFWTKRL